MSVTEADDPPLMGIATNFEGAVHKHTTPVFYAYPYPLFFIRRRSRLQRLQVGRKWRKRRRVQRRVSYQFRYLSINHSKS